MKDRSGKKKKPSGGLQVLKNLGTHLTVQAAEETLDTGMPRSPYREQLQFLLGGERRTPVLLVGPPGAASAPCSSASSPTSSRPRTSAATATWTR